MITAGTFHDGAGIAAEREDVTLKAVQFAERVSHIKGFSEGDTARLEDHYGVLIF